MRLDVGEKLLKDLWILEDADGTTGTPSWTQISTENGPSARNSHSAVYDSNTNRMIVFGGIVGVGSSGSPVLSNEVWVLENADATEEDNPPKWTKLTPADILRLDINAHQVCLTLGIAEVGVVHE